MKKTAPCFHEALCQAYKYKFGTVRPLRKPRIPQPCIFTTSCPDCPFYTPCYKAPRPKGMHFSADRISYDTTTMFDICPECTKKIVEWVKGGNICSNNTSNE